MRERFTVSNVEVRSGEYVGVLVNQGSITVVVLRGQVTQVDSAEVFHVFNRSGAFGGQTGG